MFAGTLTYHRVLLFNATGYQKILDVTKTMDLYAGIPPPSEPGTSFVYVYRSYVDLTLPVRTHFCCPPFQPHRLSPVALQITPRSEGLWRLCMLQYECLCIIHLIQFVLKQSFPIISLLYCASATIRH